MTNLLRWWCYPFLDSFVLEAFFFLMQVEQMYPYHDLIMHVEL